MLLRVLTLKSRYRSALYGLISLISLFREIAVDVSSCCYLAGGSLFVPVFGDSVVSANAWPCLRQLRLVALSGGGGSNRFETAFHVHRPGVLRHSTGKRLQVGVSNCGVLPCLVALVIYLLNFIIRRIFIFGVRIFKLKLSVGVSMEIPYLEVNSNFFSLSVLINLQN